MMQLLDFDNITLTLLPQKGVYIKSLDSLLVADVHLGKSENFQQFGLPIPSAVNQTTLDRLTQLCHQLTPKRLLVLGDLFHSRLALTESVLLPLKQFIAFTGVEVQLVLGNHDRGLASLLSDYGIQCIDGALELENVILSHEPLTQSDRLNICGHLHPCLHLRTALDRLRLPCFFLDKSAKQLILPAFGEFTGGYEVKLQPQTAAYIAVEDTIVAFEG
ncbi:ligase-associated DNA damage response endonuclease PdeM [Almyronema epifaneia]|uniref:Ligase-associated DNA damage response endonuclease PdeM n=1 Tax=Almyronema epifaneia S1 TaxID=2991925 RepID=A0ABW6IGS3_9CYAN